MENEYLLQVALELKDQMSKNMEEVNFQLKNFEKEMKNAGIGVGTLEKKVKNNTASIKGTLNKLANKAAVTGAAIVTFGAVTAKTFASTEYGIKKVQTISNKSFDEIKTGAHNLAQKYGADVSDILQTNYDLVSSMGDIAESHNMMDQASQLSLAGFTTLGGGMNALVSVLNSYKKEVSEAGNVSDILMMTQNKGITTIGELEQSLYNILPTAAALEVSFEDVSAAIATMTSNKVPTAQAATQIRSALAELAKEGTNASKVFRKLTGESFTEFIATGGELDDAFNIIAIGAKNSGLNLYDVFGSMEAANAVINLTGSNINKFRDNQDAMANSSGTTAKAVKIMADTFDTEFKKLKGTVRTVSDEIGEELIPYLKSMKEALEQVDIKELLSKENIDNAISLGKGILGISAAIWGANKAFLAWEATVKASVGIKSLMKLLAANPVTTAGIGVAGGTAYLLTKANEEAAKREAEYKKLQEKTFGNKEILENLKNILSSDGLDDEMLDNSAAILRYTEGFEGLKKTLADGDIQKALLEIDELLKEQSKNIYQKNETLVNNNSGAQFEEDITSQQIERIIDKNQNIKISLDLTEAKKQVTTLLKEINILEKLGASNEELDPLRNKLKEFENVVGTIKIETAQIEETKKEIEEFKKKFSNLDLNLNKKVELFDLTELEKAEERASEFGEALNSALELNMPKEDLSLIAEEYRKSKEQLELLKKEINANDIKTELEKELSQMNIQFEIFGTKEEDRLLKTIQILESQINKSIAEGMLGNAKELGNELKVLKEQYKEKYELPEQSSKDLDSAYNHLNTSLYQIADLVGGEFQTIVSSLISGIDAIGNSLSILGNGKTGGILGGLTSFLPGAGGILGSMSAGLGIVGAVGGIASSIFGGSDEKRRKKNKEQERQFEENTNALKELGDRLRENTSTLANFAISLIASISKSPTLHRIDGGENVLKTMEKIMMENKDFGNLSFLVKEKKKTWYGKSKSYSKNRVMGEKDLLGILGYDEGETLNDFDLDELKDFRNKLDSLGYNEIKQWAESLTSRDISSIDMSGLEAYKNNVDEFIKQIELLQLEQKELFRNATLEAFEGINVLDEKQLTEQYTQMFKDMGLDTDKYKDDIKDMVDANQVLVTSMEDVRASFIESLLNGEEDGFTKSMGSYFQKILKNAAMTVYDTLYSEIDKTMNDMFKDMADKLVDMKEDGKIDFTDFWDDFDFDKILEAQEIEADFQILIDNLRKKLEDLGVSSDVIDSMLPVSEAQQKINEIRDTINAGLSQGMSQALADNDFTSFEKSLGQSIYSSVKDSLIQAFTESEVYKQYIDEYFNMDDIKDKLEGVTDPEDAFDIIKDYMDKLNQQLESDGMGVDTTIPGNKDEDKNLGNSYYSEGTSEININITQHFTGVYGEETMYKIAKKGTIDAMKEVETQAKGIGEM